MESNIIYRLKAVYEGESGYGNGITQREKIEKIFGFLYEVELFLRANPSIEAVSGHGVSTTLYLNSYKIYKVVTTLIEEETQLHDGREQRQSDQRE